MIQWFNLVPLRCPSRPEQYKLSIARQCRLAGLSRLIYYHAPTFESEQNLLLLRRLDELYTEYPFFGSRRMLAVLRRGIPLIRSIASAYSA